MKQLEHEEQVNLMKWWTLAHKQFGVTELIDKSICDVFFTEKEEQSK